MAEVPIRIGILGYADITAKITQAINLAPNATVYAVGSRSIQKALKFAAVNDIPSDAKVYGSYEVVLDDPHVDAVYMPLPTSLHVRWAVLAAQKKKHLLVEKSVALSTAEFDAIMEACEENGVQFMDGTLWMHHPRTAQMADFLLDAQSFGQLKTIQTSFTVALDPDFLEKKIRMKPDLDALGALGDAGWYCIGRILWATNYKLPWLKNGLNEDGKHTMKPEHAFLPLSLNGSSPISFFSKLEGVVCCISNIMYQVCHSSKL